MEFRKQLKYPPASRIALLTLKGRNEEKVKFSAEHLRRELEQILKGDCSVRHVAEQNRATGSTLHTQNVFKDLVIAGPAPAPLLRAETFYRYQIMLRTRAMTALSRELACIIQTLALPADVTLAVDIDPVSLS
jgi:primosomal protein N' (replication factor Y)